VIRQDRDLEDRKQTFAALNDFVSARQGWLTSVPGDIDIRLEALPDSTLPVALRLHRQRDSKLVFTILSAVAENERDRIRGGASYRAIAQAWAAEFGIAKTEAKTIQRILARA
jgi:hypothetical protein